MPDARPKPWKAPLAATEAGPRWRIWLAAAVIAAAAVAVYSNSFSVPFLFDDTPSTVDNPTIRHLWPPWQALSPPHGKGLTVEDRPVLNYSVAINYAISGTKVWSYHVFNLAIHIAAALALFGIVRRTLEKTKIGGLPPTLFAFAVGLLWAVHPLQTESVTYVIQRAESMMSMFYLLTLYCFVRGSEVAAGGLVVAGVADPGSRPRRGRHHHLWLASSWLACGLGMETKEVMASAPIAVLLYDRAFVAGSFAEAWRRRWRYYVPLGLLFFAFLWAYVQESVFSRRGGTSGFGIDVSWWEYALTQFQAVSHYLWLSIWPHPLIFDYGTQWVTDPWLPWQVIPYVPVIAILVLGTAYCLRRRPAVGFLGFCFLAILAPSSSIMPGNRQTAAEHRMYLPLAAVIVLLVYGGWRLSRWAFARAGSGGRSPRPAFLLAVVAAAIGLGCAAHIRNETYSSALSLYRDSVEKCPDNAFARYNLGKILDESGKKLEAIPQYEAAIRIDPDMAIAHYNLGNTLTDLGRLREALEQYRETVRANPEYVKGYYNLSNTYRSLGQKEKAVEPLQDALLIDPAYTDARDNLGGLLLELGRLPEAEEQLKEVLQRTPNSFVTHYNLGNVYFLQGRFPEAVRQLEIAVRLRPDFAPARDRLEQARQQAAGSS